MLSLVILLINLIAWIASVVLLVTLTYKSRDPVQSIAYPIASRALDEEQTTKKDSSSLSNESKAVKKFQETPHIDTTANASVPATHTDKKKSHRTSIKRNDVKKNITKVDVR